jgi:iron uptake system EfeUOB component EfeO/EfeM
MPEGGAGVNIPGWRWAVGTSVVVLAVAATAIVIGVRGSGGEVALDQRVCGSHWSGPVTGRQTITLHNASPDPVDVYLIDPEHDLVYAEARDLTPGLDRPLATTLGTGRYALRCVFTDGTVLTSKTYRVTGSSGSGVAGIAPLPDLDLQQPVAAYRAYVRAQLPVLLRAADVLDGDVERGDLSRARVDWLPAHLDYERLGAAYNTFEAFDGEINGTVDGLGGGVADPAWTGFFRIEYGLWHRQSATALKPLASGLVADIGGLIADFPSEDTDPVDLPLRSHEILENALEFQVSGINDEGSGSTLATVYANTQGTQAVLATLTALIADRDPALLTSIDRSLATVRTELLRCRTGNAWIAASRLPQRQRQQLDGDLGGLLEQLAEVPNLLAERTAA